MPLDRKRLNEHMRRFAAGDREAFDYVFEELWPVVRDYVRRVLHDERDREDVAQAALMAVFSQVTSYDPTRDATAWALTIAGYEALTARRRNERRRELVGVDLVDLGEVTDDPESVLVQAEMMAIFADLLAELPDADRAAILGDLSGTVRERAARRKRKQRVLTRLQLSLRRLYGSG